MSDNIFPMKTGFNMLKEDPEDLKKDIVSYITLFLENAIRSASIYAVKHGGRKTITKEDIKRCMMLEVFLFIKRPGIDQKITEMKQKIFEESDEDEYTTEEEGECEDEPFEESKCKCGLCTCITNIYERWNSWTPTNKMEEIFHKHINNM